jgi:hypothetical protein
LQQVELAPLKGSRAPTRRSEGSVLRGGVHEVKQVVVVARRAWFYLGEEDEEKPQAETLRRVARPTTQRPNLSTRQ